MNHLKFQIIIFVFILGLISCTNYNLKGKVQGQWAIEEITYSGRSYKDQMDSNVLIFKENNDVSIPETFHFDKDKNANWSVQENQNIIVINTTNIAFNDSFNVEFVDRTDTKPLGIILESKNIYIKAYKLLDFY